MCDVKGIMPSFLVGRFQEAEQPAPAPAPKKTIRQQFDAATRTAQKVVIGISVMCGLAAWDYMAKHPHDVERAVGMVILAVVAVFTIAAWFVFRHARRTPDYVSPAVAEMLVEAEPAPVPVRKKALPPPVPAIDQATYTTAVQVFPELEAAKVRA